MKTKKLTNILKDAKSASNQKTEPYDATGIVKRIENGVAWVHIGGGVDETPVRLTMNAKEGDAVQVRVSGGKAWLTGNATSPPTDDTVAYHATHVAQTAQANAQNAGIIAEESQAIAIEASQTVEELSETAITNVVVQYAVGTSPSVAPVSGWSTNSPTWEEGKYIWQRTVTTINGVQIPSNVACIQGAKGSDGTSVTILGSYETLAELEAAHPTGTEGDAYMVNGDLYVWNGTEWENVGQIQGPQGPTGKGISKVQTEYYLSTSTSSATGGSWSETPQVFISGRYYWTRDHIYYDDNTDGYSTAVYNKGLTQANQEALDLQQYFWYKDGTGAEAGAHVTEIPQSDFETTPSGGNLLMKSNKVALRNALVELASFGANGATIGQIENGKSRSEITANGMRIVRRDSNADTEIANLGYGSGNDGQGGVSDAPYYTLGTRENDTQDYSSASTYNVGDMVTYNGSVYICVERIITPESFTPSHWSSILKGNYSCAEGYGVIAQGVASHAEGGYTRAMGKYSHAEGYFSIASGTYSHAEGNATASETFSHAEGNSYSSGVDAHAEGAASARGYVSHAEGSSDATGRWSHSEGFASLASAECSHAQNEGTVADQTNQTAIGQYNTKNNTNNLFVVGKGSSDSNRSDAFSVDANGNVESAGVLTASGLPSGLTTEQHSGNTGSISATTDSGSKSITATKPGYYPLGVVGWNFTGTNYMYQNLYYCRISSASDGSATVSYRFRNNSSASYSGTFNVDILWVKI